MKEECKHWKECTNPDVDDCINYGCQEYRRAGSEFLIEVKGCDNLALKREIERACDKLGYRRTRSTMAHRRIEIFALREIEPAIISQNAAAFSTEIPDELFDGPAVYSELTKAEKKYTTPEAVSAVLDAVVSLIRNSE